MRAVIAPPVDVARYGWALVVAFAATLGGCNPPALGPDPSVGATPALPAPTRALLPTVHVAKATGWPANTGPVAASGLAASAFATGLDHPRWLFLLPNGDVPVAETNAPPKPDDAKGLRGFFMQLAMSRAGAATPSANRITLLRDANGDGVAETRVEFLRGLNSPFGMALVDGYLYVANLWPKRCSCPSRTAGPQGCPSRFSRAS